MKDSEDGDGIIFEVMHIFIKFMWLSGDMENRVA